MRWLDPHPFDLDAWLRHMAEEPMDPVVTERDDGRGYPLLLRRRKGRAPAKSKPDKRAASQ